MERWQQRFENFEKTYIFLHKNIGIENPTEIEKAGIIQSFEVCFELAWKTIKDYLNYKQVMVQFPREVIKEAFSYEIIKNGNAWLDMLNKRNLVAHTYNGNIADTLYNLIKNEYIKEINELYTYLKNG